jgi:LysR family carnitine catabolism transcriptional activator
MLQGCRLISSSRSGGVWRQISPLLSSVEMEDSGFEVEHLTTVAGLVRNGLGVAIVPASSLHQFAEPGLRSIPIVSEGMRRQVLLVTRRNDALSPTAEMFLQQLRRTPLNVHGERDPRGPSASVSEPAT